MLVCSILMYLTPATFQHLFKILILPQRLANHALALERVGDGRSQDFMSAMRGWPPVLPQASN